MHILDPANTLLANSRKGQPRRTRALQQEIKRERIVKKNGGERREDGKMFSGGVSNLAL